MKKRITAFICAIALLVSAVFVYNLAFANEIDWDYNEKTKTLYLYSGEMDDYDGVYGAPWGAYILEMKNLEVRDGITKIGNFAFAGAQNLENVLLPESISYIGENAFASTDSLCELTFSQNVSYIGDLSFTKIGLADKESFLLNVNPGSYALYYAIKNKIDFNCESVKSGELSVEIKKNTGMRAYFPYTSPVNGNFCFYSVSKNDPIGYVFDSEFNQLATNDDHGSTKYDGMADVDFAVNIELTKGETYYFATNIYSPSSASSFKAYLVPTSYNVTGDIRALISADGTLSDKLTDATLNGNATGGTYSINVTGAEFEGVFSCDGVNYVHSFKPEDGDSIDIVMVLCDRNGDRVVNAKDYALLKKSNSQYITIFDNQINFRYNKDFCYRIK